MLVFSFLFDNLAQCGNLIYQGFILYGFIFVFHVTVKISTAENTFFSRRLFSFHCHQSNYCEMDAWWICKN